jgi:hypothetical protein
VQLIEFAAVRGDCDAHGVIARGKGGCASGGRPADADVAALCETGWVTPEAVAKVAVVHEKPTSVVYGPLRDMSVEPSVNQQTRCIKMAESEVQNPGFEDPTKVARSPEYRAIYVNSIKLRVSIFEMAITLGRQAEITPSAEGLIEEAVLLMPQHCKGLAVAMARAVANYEAQFGPLPGGCCPNDTTEERMTAHAQGTRMQKAAN